MPTSPALDFLKLVLEALPMAAGATRVSDGTLVHVNEAFVRLTGYSKDDIVGRRTTDVGITRMADAEAQRLRAMVAEGGLHEFDAQIHTKDGRTLPLRQTLRALDLEGETYVVSTTLGPSGAPIEEDRFRTMLDSAPDAMVIVDKKGRITLVNSQTEKVFGWARADLLGQPIEVLVPDWFRAGHEEHRADYAKDPKARPMGAGPQLFARRKDGSEFPAEISLSPLQTEGGQLVTAAIRDISNRRRVEEELRRAKEAAETATKAKADFLANMSHEMRTPLNAILGFSQLLLDERGKLPKEAREYIGDVHASATHLKSLVDDILDLSKVDAGKMEFRSVPFEVGGVVNEVLETLGPLALEKKIRVDRTVDRGASRIVADQGRLRQVLYNLVSNALKFTPDGGRVSVRASADGGAAVRIEVEDSGIGIKPDQVPLLFTEFRQLDSSPMKKHAGTGLGLALTKRIVEAQGGQVGVTSKPGKGSLFWVTLPRDVPAALASHEAKRRMGELV